MPVPEKGLWFRYEGVWVRWWTASPIHRAAYCEAKVCKGETRRVERDELRLEVDNDRGRERIKSRGKKNQWVCFTCAADVPNRPMSENQETLL